VFVPLSGERRWKKALGAERAVLGLQTGKAADDGTRCLPMSQGGATETVWRLHLAGDHPGALRLGRTVDPVRD
jgi:hypothetical protein